MHNASFPALYIRNCPSFPNSKGIPRLIYWKKTKQLPLPFRVERQMDIKPIYFYNSSTMQKVSTNDQQSSPLLLFMLFGFILSNAVNWFNNVPKVLSKCWFFLQSQLRIGSLKACGDSDSQYSESFNEQLCFNRKKDDTSLRREEAKMVMENLGLLYSNESEELKELMDSKELSQLFDQQEPSLEEIKEAFDIFDEKSKGFIDEEDLQRVLHKLNFKERFDLESCRKMIKKFDDNGDGRIDFIEFIKFMENSFFD
uniref:EF-hand domain-containing protein n=1 Tax=Rhizophora mucronata TaxID=61149 RepID=A0A2P2NTB8_RHIMU